MHKNNSLLLFLLFSLFSFINLHSGNIGLISTQENGIHERNKSFFYYVDSFKALGHNVEYLWENANFNEYDLIISWNWKPFLSRCKEKVILLCFEPEVIIQEHGDFRLLSSYYCVFTWNHKICNKKQYEKFYYPSFHNKDILPSHLPPHNEKKLACMINSHKSENHKEELYSIRKNIVKFYEQYYPDDFELYGRSGWRSGKFKVFKGKCKNKNQVLQNHKFNYCFENWYNDYHYISEKIFDSFSNLCVPIYLGAKHICDYIPDNTFIDARNFKNIRELHLYIKTMDEETYNKYIQAIVKFNQSKLIEKFTHKHLKNSILEKVKEKMNQK